MPMLVKFLTNIVGVDKKTASEDACKIEHVISADTSERLSKFVEFVETVPTGKSPKWIESFKSYLKTGKHRKCKP